MSVTGNKRELAHKLGVSLPTFSGWLLRYGADFPIKERGSSGREYVFDFAAVFDFLRLKREEQENADVERDEELAQLKLPFAVPGIEPTRPKLSAKDELDAWRLRRLQREEAERSGALMPTQTALTMFSDVLVRLSRDTHAFLRQVGQEQNWPDSYMRRLEARFGDLQRTLVKDLDQLLGGAADRSDERERLLP